jgi:hypothetical protein
MGISRLRSFSIIIVLKSSSNGRKKKLLRSKLPILLVITLWLSQAETLSNIRVAIAERVVYLA